MSSFNLYTEDVFWDFKRRDNVEFNFEIIIALINSASILPIEVKQYYFKPIYIILAGILECLLYDQLIRVKQHTNEKMGLSLEDILKVKDKDIPNKLFNYAELGQKCRLLGDDPAIYERIKKVSKTRNRVHMQNIEHIYPLDEHQIWTIEAINDVGSLTSAVFQHLYIHHPRSGFKAERSLPEFPTPWAKLS